MDSADRRYQRTHKLIKSELEAMLMETDYAEITVKELCERANINRKTFYNHFSDLDAVLEELLGTFVDQTMSFLNNTAFSGGKLKVRGVLSGFFRTLRDKMPFHRRMLCSPDCRKVREKIMSMLDTKNLRIVSGYLDLQDFRNRVIMNFLTAGIMPIYAQWLESDQSMSDEELGTLLEDLILHGISGMVNVE